ASLVVTSLFFPERVAPPGPTLFPYTTLFRSGASASAADGIQQVGRHRPGAGQCEGSEESHSLLLGRNLRVGYPGLSASNPGRGRSEEHTSELQSREKLVCRLLLEKKKKKKEP